jgi:hypothetical protein
MILDTMTYSVMVVVAALSFIVILLALFPRGRQNKSDK